jgi:hypothetical protein
MMKKWEDFLKFYFNEIILTIKKLIITEICAIKLPLYINYNVSLAIDRAPI